MAFISLQCIIGVFFLCKMALFIALFTAGLLTILLPCILPLIPIVLGVSIAGRSKLRPLMTIFGMLVSFVGFTYLLLVVFDQFVEAADYLRIGTYYVLLLFGLGFAFHNAFILYVGAILGSLFFWDKGYISLGIAAVLGVIAMYVGGKVATKIQSFGTRVQDVTRTELGADNPLGAFIIGLTMGLVWVPCAGPALSFAFTLVRDEPGLRAIALLATYGLGTALPLLLIGYGGQAAVHSVRALTKYSGIVKVISGYILILTALAFQFHLFTELEVYFVQKTNFGSIGTDLENQLFGDQLRDAYDEEFHEEESSSSAASTSSEESSSSASSVSSSSSLKASSSVPRASSSEPRGEIVKSSFPVLAKAPEFTGLGPWHNSEPLTMEGLRGKVVLVDFWTYSCINCIRTLPYIQGYAEKYADAPFVIVGVHAPEFVFEKSEANVAAAIERYDLTYPTAQDNDFKTWRAFSNRYWPAKYLIDAEGNIRYTHFGEGAYEETDEAIEGLLKEIGVHMTEDVSFEDPEKGRKAQTPETYLGPRSWDALGNGQAFPSSSTVNYKEPSNLALHTYYLVGDWQVMDDERQVLKSSEGEILMKFLGGEINLVMGMEDSASPAKVEVEVDGSAVKNFTIDKQDLFELWKGEYGEHEIRISITGQGAAGYAFTFGN